MMRILLAVLMFSAPAFAQGVFRVGVAEATSVDAGTLLQTSVPVGGSASSVVVTLAAGQSSNISLYDHIKFDTVQSTVGSLITCDTSTTYTTAKNAASIGRCTLTGGHAYHLDFSPGTWKFSGSGGVAFARIVDADTMAPISNLIIPVNEAAAATNYETGAVIANFAPSVNTRIQVELVVTPSSLTQIGGDVQTMADGGTFQRSSTPVLRVTSFN